MQNNFVLRIYLHFDLFIYCKKQIQTALRKKHKMSIPTFRKKK